MNHPPVFLEEALSPAELYGPAMELQTQEEADAYFAGLVARCMRLAVLEREDAEKIQRMNLGYYAGYFSSETRARVEKLFGCEHPVLGSIEKNGVPTTEFCLQKGKEAALNIGRLA